MIISSLSATKADCHSAKPVTHCCSTCLYSSVTPRNFVCPLLASCPPQGEREDSCSWESCFLRLFVVNKHVLLSEKADTTLDSEEMLEKFPMSFCMSLLWEAANCCTALATRMVSTGRQYSCFPLHLPNSLCGGHYFLPVYSVRNGGKKEETPCSRLFRKLGDEHR